MNKKRIGFIGAGGIARSHAFALNSLKYYYNDPPGVELIAVTSFREESRLAFASEFGFRKAVTLEEFISDHEIDSVFILGPNSVHYQHLEAVVAMPGVRRIYLEKPVCSNYDEENKIKNLLTNIPQDKSVQAGFQFLMGAAVREALIWWKGKDFGRPIHFSFTLKHSDYLQASYRAKRRTRLTPAPDGGAMADLGSHAISLMVAFLGDDLQVLNALQSGSFEDVPAGSDLYSEISVFDPKSRAVGNVSGSRVSAGTGDMLAFEIYAEKGALRYNTMYPDRFEYFFVKNGDWAVRYTGSNFSPVTGFPSGHVPAGWLRSLIHALYVFLTGKDKLAFVPDLDHGLEVQRIVRETSEHMGLFRKKYG